MSAKQPTKQRKGRTPPGVEVTSSTTHDEALFTHVRAMAKRDPIARHVLDNGRSFTPGGRPRGMRKLRDGRCYWNSWSRAAEQSTRDPDHAWGYCEGYALRVDGRIEGHGWCLAEDGTVIETTYQAPALAYFGVEIPLETVARTVLEHGSFADGGACGVRTVLGRQVYAAAARGGTRA